MMKRSFLSLIALSWVWCGCASKSDTAVRSGYDEKEMAAAIARARSEVDTFIRELAHPTGTDHAVKAPIRDGNNTEHVWLSEVTYKDGKFEGTIDNQPEAVRNVKIGQRWVVEKYEISDWMFLRNGKMYGNYTLRPLLKTMPEDEAEQLRSILAEP